jgi:hypothetical protein
MSNVPFPFFRNKNVRNKVENGVSHLYPLRNLWSNKFQKEEKKVEWSMTHVEKNANFFFKELKRVFGGGKNDAFMMTRPNITPFHDGRKLNGKRIYERPQKKHL